MADGPAFVAYGSRSLMCSAGCSPGEFSGEVIAPAGMTETEILADYPELTEADVRACLAYAADRERRVLTAP